MHYVRDETFGEDRCQIWTATGPQALAAMAPACRDVALTATWDSYANRFATLCRGLLEAAA